MPSVSDMVAELRRRAGAARAEALRCDRAADALEEVDSEETAARPSGKSAKSRRVSNARRPTTRGAKPGVKRGATRERIEARLREHPLEDRAVTAEKLGIKPNTLAYHLKQMRKAGA